MKRLAAVVSFTLLVAPILLASDVTGKWSGTAFVTRADGQTEQEHVLLNLKQKDTELTGTAGPGAEEQHPIQKGTVEGNSLTFEVQADERLFKVELTLVDDRLKGEAKSEHDGKTVTAVLDLQRKSE